MYIKETNKQKYLQAGLDISGLTVRKVLADNGIHPGSLQKSPHYHQSKRHPRWRFVWNTRIKIGRMWYLLISPTLSLRHCDAGVLIGVLPRAREACLPQNLNHKFA